MKSPTVSIPTYPEESTGMGEGELKVKLKMGVDFIGTTGRKRFKKWSFWFLVSLMWSIVMLFAYVKLYVDIYIYIYIAQANPITLNVRPPHSIAFLCRLEP